MVARVTMEGLSARESVIFVRFAEKPSKSMTLTSTRRSLGGEGGGKGLSGLAVLHSAATWLFIPTTGGQGPGLAVLSHA